MKTVLHCADLHISSSDEKTKQYCLGVLDEIIEHTKSQKADFLIFAGDIFNSYKDVTNMKGDFRSRIKTLPDSCEVIFVTGNHEYLYSGMKNPKISGIDLGISSGNVVEYTKERPLMLFKYEGIEFLAIPHNSEYSSYINWELPEKENYRLCIAHAQVSGFNFEGINEDVEEETTLLDPDVFDKVKADYVAMGHIHSSTKHKLSNNCELSYPGSARVWRSGEKGERKLEILTIDDKAHKIMSITLLPIKSAGQYRHYELPLDLDGGCIELDNISKAWGSNDYIDIRFEGIVDDENMVAELESSIISKFNKKVRELHINRENVFAVDGISSHVIAKKFIDIWERDKPAEDEEDISAWLKARQIGLTHIKRAIEALQ